MFKENRVQILVCQVLALQIIELDKTSISFSLKGNNSHRWSQRLSERMYRTLGLMVRWWAQRLFFAVDLKLSLHFLKVY